MRPAGRGRGGWGQCLAMGGLGGHEAARLRPPSCGRGARGGSEGLPGETAGMRGERSVYFILFYLFLCLFYYYYFLSFFAPCKGGCSCGFPPASSVRARAAAGGV